MRVYIVLLVSLSLFIFSGCVNLTKSEPVKPKPTQKIEIVLLNKQVQELNAKDKQLIYRSIQDNINKYNKQGDEAYKYGYNYDAIKAYELVNFYEGYSYVPKKKIDKIKRQAKRESALHYKKGIKYSKTNKRRAILEFNLVLMNAPKYKDTQKKLAVLKSDRNIKIQINTLDSSLRTKMLNCKGKINELKDISSDLHKLLKFDYKNSVALKARDLLQKYNRELVKEAIELYEKGNMRKSKNRFKKILLIYKDNTTVLRYLKKIKLKSNVQKNLNLAKKHLRKKNYLNSIKHAKLVLKIDYNNKKAKKIIMTAKRESRKNLIAFIKEGKKQYKNNELEKSRKNFKEALKIDPRCNEALIYFKKIKRQLSTINSLR